MEYIQSEPLSGCLFCQKHSEKKDEENYIFFRSGLSFLMLNLYPYNTGHLMAAPVRHVGDITFLYKKEIIDIMALVQKGVRALTKVYNPEGFNIGLNLGAVAGAGITDHLHIHIVPRWQGDTNFMPVLADTKVIPQHLQKTYNALLPLFAEPE
ncbi:MAG: HIT family protein [bacterium]